MTDASTLRAPTPPLRPGGVAVLGKAMRLIDLLAEHGEMTPARLADLAEEPRSTVYRLISTLEELGLVDAGPSRGTYRLGLKFFTLGSTVVERFDERSAARPAMERLHDAIGETVFLCVRREQHAVCIERIDGQRVALLELRLGGALALHLGAAPRALLAYEPRSVWSSYLDDIGVLEQRTPHGPASRAELLAELEATRARGYAISDQDVTPGVASVGAPVFGHTGAVRASLSIGGLRDLVLAPETDVCGLVVRAAGEVSHALGHRP